MWDLGERVIKGVEGRGLWRWDTVGGSRVLVVCEGLGGCRWGVLTGVRCTRVQVSRDTKNENNDMNAKVWMLAQGPSGYGGGWLLLPASERRRAALSRFSL